MFSPFSVSPNALNALRLFQTLHSSDLEHLAKISDLLSAQMGTLVSQSDISSSDLNALKGFHEQLGHKTKALLDKKISRWIRSGETGGFFNNVDVKGRFDYSLESLQLPEGPVKLAEHLGIVSLGNGDAIYGGTARLRLVASERLKKCLPTCEGPIRLSILRALKETVQNVARTISNQTEQIEKTVTTVLSEETPAELLHAGGSLFAPVPFEVIERILRNCTLTSYCTMYCVSKVFCMKTQPFIDILRHPRSLVFGKKQWEERYGPIGEEPPLPEGFFEKIDQVCPYEVVAGDVVTGKISWKCLLILIPETIKGAPYTFNVCKQIVANPLRGHVMQIEVYYDKITEEHGETPSGKAHWGVRGGEVIAGHKNHIAEMKYTETTEDTEHPDWYSRHLLEIMTVESVYFNVTEKHLIEQDSWIGKTYSSLGVFLHYGPPSPPVLLNIRCQKLSRIRK